MSPSTTEDRLAQIAANYQQALEHEADDLARATTPEQIAALQDNLAQAAALFYQTAADRLAAQGDAVEDAFAAAVAANDAVARARQGDIDMGDLTQTLGAATTAAQSLLRAADPG